VNDSMLGIPKCLKDPSGLRDRAKIGVGMTGGRILSGTLRLV